MHATEYKLNSDQCAKTASRCCVMNINLRTTLSSNIDNHIFILFN